MGKGSHGSNLNGNYAPIRLSSGWKPTIWHDILDFHAKNPHDAHNPWHSFETKVRGLTVRKELSASVSFVIGNRYKDATSYVAKANHDEMFDRFLRDSDWRNDPTNAEIYLDANQFVLSELRKDPSRSPDPFKYCAEKLFGAKLKGINFLQKSDSLVVAGVELAPHGHQGPNGARGNHRNGIRTARRQVSGHEHSPASREGYLTVGTCHRFVPMPKYARGGASGWAHTHGIVYPNGKTAHVFIHAGRARALGRKRA